MAKMPDRDWEEMLTKAKKLVQLLEGPQYGLTTWYLAVAHNVKELSDYCCPHCSNCNPEGS